MQRQLQTGGSSVTIMLPYTSVYCAASFRRSPFTLSLAKIEPFFSFNFIICGCTRRHLSLLLVYSFSLFFNKFYFLLCFDFWRWYRCSTRCCLYIFFCILRARFVSIHLLREIRHTFHFGIYSFLAVTHWSKYNFMVDARLWPFHVWTIHRSSGVDWLPQNLIYNTIYDQICNSSHTINADGERAATQKKKTNSTTQQQEDENNPLHHKFGHFVFP